MNENVKEIMSLVAKKLAIPFIREQQDVPKPPYPYFSYFITHTDGSRYSKVKDIPNNDPIKITQKFNKRKYAVVSLSFLSRADVNKKNNALAEINELAEKAKDYLELESLDFKNFGIVKVIDQKITDRTSIIESYYENKVGFDIEVHSTRQFTREVDAIDLESTFKAIQVEVE